MRISRVYLAFAALTGRLSTSACFGLANVNIYYFQPGPEFAQIVLNVGKHRPAVYPDMQLVCFRFSIVLTRDKKTTHS